MEHRAGRQARAAGRARELKRTELYHRVRGFMEQYAFLAPVVQVLPFDVNQPWVTEINGQRMSFTSTG